MAHDFICVLQSVHGESVSVAAFTSITHTFKISLRKNRNVTEKEKIVEHQYLRLEQITTYMKHLSLLLKRRTLDLNEPLN